jgi:endonuclease-3 related protein
MKRKYGFYNIYKKLRNHFGFQNWWPAKTKFEILVGAVLTQQTSWKNVEKAINNLRKSKLLNEEKLKNAKIEEIEKAIRNVNFYKTKAIRLKEIVKNLNRIKKEKEEKRIKQLLLSLKGIGEETCEVLMLYYFNFLDFVIDAYTMRIFERIFNKKFKREELKKLIESEIPKNLEVYKDFHAQLDELGKNYCKKKPKCEECPLNKICSYREKIFKSKC